MNPLFQGPPVPDNLTQPMQNPPAMTGYGMNPDLIQALLSTYQQMQEQEAQATSRATTSKSQIDRYENWGGTGLLGWAADAIGNRKAEKLRPQQEEALQAALLAKSQGADISDQIKRIRDIYQHGAEADLTQAASARYRKPDALSLYMGDTSNLPEEEIRQRVMDYYNGRNKGRGVTVNTAPQGPQYGTIPQGWFVDSDGVMKPVPGGPAERELAGAAEQGEAREAGKGAQAMNVIDEIDNALNLLGSWTSGIGGAVARNVPGSPSVDFEASMKTILGNVGFDRLQKMREESPTGGALGQVSNIELGLLTSAVSGYDPNQSEEAKRRTLEKIKKHYGNFITALDGQMPEDYQGMDEQAIAGMESELGGVSQYEGAAPEQVSSDGRHVKINGQWYEVLQQ